MKTALVRTIHFLHSRGFAPATSSNYSIRESGTTDYWVSESGVDKADFTTQHLILVDKNGKTINDARRTSAETDLHTTIYNLFPAAQCILHTHSVLGTILSQTTASAICLENYEILKALEGISTHATTVYIPIFDNTQDIPSLSAALRAHYAQQPHIPAFLIRGHGLYTWASSVAAAKRHIEAIEFLLECVYKKSALR